MAIAQAYVGTSTVGSLGLNLATNVMYVKKITLGAGDFLSAISVHLKTTDNISVSVQPVLYDNNGGVPGKQIALMDTPSDAVMFNGDDRWLEFPIHYYSQAGEDVWIGIHSRDPGGTPIQLSYETTGGDDRNVNSGSSWTIDPAAVGGSTSDPGSHLYSIRASVITGLTDSYEGRTTVGASSFDMSTTVVYLRSVTIPGDSVLAAVGGRLAHTVANVPFMRCLVFDDDAGAPGKLVASTITGDGNTVLMSTASRWVYGAIGLWVPTTTTFWIGWQKVGNQSMFFAYDATGGDGGTMTAAADPPLLATWTAGDDDYSFHALVLSA